MCLSLRRGDLHGIKMHTITVNNKSGQPVGVQFRVSNDCVHTDQYGSPIDPMGAEQRFTGRVLVVPSVWHCLEKNTIGVDFVVTQVWIYNPDAVDPLVAANIKQ